MTVGPLKNLLFLGLQNNAEEGTATMTAQVQTSLKQVKTIGNYDNWRQAGLLSFYRQATSNCRVAYYYQL